MSRCAKFWGDGTKDTKPGTTSRGDFLRPRLPAIEMGAAASDDGAPPFYSLSLAYRRLDHVCLVSCRSHSCGRLTLS